MPGAIPTAELVASAGGLPRRQAILVCVTAAVVVLMGAGLCSAAILVPAPAAVVPLVAACCAGLPLLGGWRLPTAIASLRRPSQLSLAALRRELAKLPETEHPFGL
jgi:hypothetical protein